MTVKNTIQRILVLGNGFDIAQGLPTKYTDFIDFLRIPQLPELIKEIQKGAPIQNKYKKYFDNVEKIDYAEMLRLHNMVNSNAWAQYFLNCNADIQGWIDLEKEMLPVLSFFQWLFDQRYKMIVKMNVWRARIEATDENPYRMAKLLPQFVIPAGKDDYLYYLYIHEEFCNSQYGVYIDKILNVLKEELDEFIEIFRIYLREIVGQINKKNNRTVNKLKADMIISFNYLKSEMFHKNLSEVETIHVHGDSMIGNMVLGVNSVDHDMENDFLYFTKSFQRIRMQCNPKYRDYWNGLYELTFFGHSLDISDVDIIKPFYENAKKVTVYYLNEKDYETKIINLIKMSKISKIENDVYTGRLVMMPIK